MIDSASISPVFTMHQKIHCYVNSGHVIEPETDGLCCSPADYRKCNGFFQPQRNLYH